MLALALVQHRIGAESWAGRASGGFYPAGPRLLEAQSGQRILNDRPGLTVYESDPLLRFASMNARAVRGVPAEQFATTFANMASAKSTLTDRGRISVDLFHASFFEPAGDMRLIVLVMAVEALLDLPPPRSDEAIALVDSFIRTVRNSSVSEGERASLEGALRWLRQEFIRGAGKSLAAHCLGERTYDGRAPGKFFADCYDLRSELVHGGDIRKARERAGACAGQLEVFVSPANPGLQPTAPATIMGRRG